MKTKIVQFPNDKLNNPVFTEEYTYEEIRDAADKMFKQMRQKRGGVGMAANQMNIPIRMFVAKNEGRAPLIFVNPKIIYQSPEQELGAEGCLSFSKNITYNIYRSKSIEVEYKDLLGNKVKEVFDGFLAKVIQHEVDHLNGITMFDRWKEQNEKAS